MQVMQYVLLLQPRVPKVALAPYAGKEDAVESKKLKIIQETMKTGKRLQKVEISIEILDGIGRIRG